MTDFYLFKSALRDLLRVRRLLVTALLIAVPAAIALLIRIKADPGSFKAAQAYDVLAPALVFGFLLVILAVVYGSGVISQEFEQNTIVYLLTLPLPPRPILLMNFL